LLPERACGRRRRSRNIAVMTTWNETGGENHELGGNTLQELYDEIDSWGQDEAGSCSWAPSINFAWDDNQIVTGATLTVDIAVLTPAWLNRSAANDAVRGEWDRWSAALMTHEMGHYDLAKQYLDNFEDSLVGMAHADAQAAFDQRVKDLQQASDSYDASTQHGITQGTTLDTSIT
jgi:predicted secreted Zn-dependent protease